MRLPLWLTWSTLLVGLVSMYIAGWRPEHFVSGIDGVRFPTTGRGVERGDALLTGTLVEVDGCLRVRVDPDGYEVVVIWPDGYGVRMDEGRIGIHNRRGRIVAHVGDTIHVGGGSEPSDTHVDGCPGEVFHSDGSGDITVAAPTPIPSPTPMPDEMAAWGLRYLTNHGAFEERSGNPQVVLSRCALLEEIAEVWARSGSPPGISPGMVSPDTGARCDPDSDGWAIIVQGDWWTREDTPRKLANYILALPDRKAPGFGVVPWIPSCNAARFKPLLHDPTLPDAEPGYPC